MRHKLSKWPYEELKFTAISVLCYSKKKNTQKTRLFTLNTSSFVTKTLVCLVNVLSDVGLEGVTFLGNSCRTVNLGRTLGTPTVGKVTIGNLK
jgi:hypothetical protein